MRQAARRAGPGHTRAEGNRSVRIACLVAASLLGATGVIRAQSVQVTFRKGLQEFASWTTPGTHTVSGTLMPGGFDADLYAGVWCTAIQLQDATLDLEWSLDLDGPVQISVGNTVASVGGFLSVPVQKQSFKLDTSSQSTLPPLQGILCPPDNSFMEASESTTTHGASPAITGWTGHNRVRGYATGACYATASAGTGVAFQVSQPTNFTLTATMSVIAAGSSQGNPYLSFSNCVSFCGDCCSNLYVLSSNLHGWYDPPLSHGFRFTGIAPLKFTKIRNFPVGIDGDDVFSVSAGGVSLGDFVTGQSVDFVGLTGSPVTTFEVTGIDPLVDAASAVAFPIELEFDSSPGEFTMEALYPPWAGLGSGLGGSLGTPNLAGSGALLAGSAGSLALSGAKPAAAALLFVSLGSVPTPFKGGVLVPVPVLFSATLTVDASGAVILPFVWPVGIPSATWLWFQCAVQDPTAPHGVSLSTALLGMPP